MKYIWENKVRHDSEIKICENLGWRSIQFVSEQKTNLNTMRVLIFILISFLCFDCEAQKRDFHWAFGQNVGIDFNTSVPTIDTTIIMMSMEPSASICDENGNLLFYVGSPTTNQMLPQKYIVRNALDSIMPGGDSLAGHTSMTQGLIIVPDPGDSMKYYIFHITKPPLTIGDRLYYSIIDMSLNGGMGEVVSSNNLLNNNVWEKMHAVKAANGKDWWLISMYQNTTSVFYKYKLDSAGVHYKGSQNYSTLLNGSGGGQMIFSENGNKLLYAGAVEISYLFDFDRCLGEFSNQVPLDTFTFGIDAGGRYGASLSPSGRYAYLSTSEGYIDSLWQFDTQASNVSASRQLIFTTQPLDDFTLGQHMLGPDGKIYIANVYAGGLPSMPFDSLNTHLSVIQYPDSPGVACNFAPYNFNLSGRISLGSIPNMLNYNLGPLENVNCDSILAANIHDWNIQNKFNVYPNPSSEKVTIKWNSPNRAKTISIELMSMEGKTIKKYELEKLDLETIIDISDVHSGMYILKFANDTLILESHKIIINH